MTIGRLIVGFGVGSAAAIVPLYIAEMSPSKYRGRMIGLDNMSITGGQLLSYGIGAAYTHVKGGWWCYSSHHPRYFAAILPRVSSTVYLPRQAGGSS